MLCLIAGNSHTGPARSRTAAAAARMGQSVMSCSSRTVDLVLAGNWNTVRGLPGLARSLAAGPGSSADWGTAAGTPPAAGLCPAGTPPAAGCIASSHPHSSAAWTPQRTGRSFAPSRMSADRHNHCARQRSTAG